MSHTAIIQEVCDDIGQIKQLMKTRGKVAYRDNGEFENPENVSWAELILIGTGLHPRIHVPDAVGLADAYASLDGIDGGALGILGHALQLAANGERTKAGEALQGLADVLLDPFAAQLSENLANNRARYGRATSPTPISEFAGIHNTGAIVVNQPPAFATRQAV